MVDIDFDSEEAFANMELEDLNFSTILDMEIYASLPYAADIILGHLIDYTPVRTGLTAASWQVIAVDRDEYYITNTNEPIITFLIEGTAAHDIYPVQASMLHWEDDAGEHFAHSVHVQGILPTPIEELALDASTEELDQLWSAVVDTAVMESELD
jgi:hypothetical protein